MPKLILLLRGINVGGVKVPMAELKSCLDGAGFSCVETILNTGNVVCESPFSALEAVVQAENILSSTFGYSARVLVRTPSALSAVVENFSWQDVPETSHRYVVFTDDQAVADSIFAAGSSLVSADERLAVGDQCLYWVVPKGETLGTELSKLFSKAKYKASTTTRNLNTVEKLVALAEK